MQKSYRPDNPNLHPVRSVRFVIPAIQSAIGFWFMYAQAPSQPLKTSIKDSGRALCNLGILRGFNPAYKHPEVPKRAPYSNELEI